MLGVHPNFVVTNPNRSSQRNIRVVMLKSNLCFLASFILEVVECIIIMFSSFIALFSNFLISLRISHLILAMFYTMMLDRSLNMRHAFVLVMVFGSPTMTMNYKSFFLMVSTLIVPLSEGGLIMHVGN